MATEIPKLTPESSIFAGNPSSFLAIGIVLLYILLAASTHIVLLGVLPFFVAFRALRQGEQLAPIAMAVVVVGVIFALHAVARFY